MSSIKIQKIEEKYNELLKKLKELGSERQGVVRNYIKELETKKVGAIRASLGLLDNNQK